MGLTIHYDISVPTGWIHSVIVGKLQAARDFAVELGFREVSEVVEFQDQWCDFNWIRANGHEDNDEFFWAKIQSQRHFQSPYEPGRHRSQSPNRMIVFSAWPTYGAEQMNIGVCSYPRFVIPADKEITYSAWSEVFSGLATPEQKKVLHDWMKKWNLRKMREPKRRPWRNTINRIWETENWWASAEIVEGDYISHRRGRDISYGLVRMRDTMRGQIEFKYQGSVEDAIKAFSNPEFQKETSELMYGREVVIPAAFGSWGSFIKTQYAMEGGIDNFLKAHLGAIVLLDKLKELGFILHVSDEGNFWEKRDVKALVEEIASWDAMIAAFAGAMKDMLPEGMLESPIFNRPNFEHLEMKGLGQIEAFLKALPSTTGNILADDTN